jgi:hypothetical protein
MRDERLTPEDQADSFDNRPGIHHPDRRYIEYRKLTECVSGKVALEYEFLTARADPRDLDLTGDDHEHRVGGVSLAEQEGALSEPSAVSGGFQPVEILPSGASEDRRTRQ